VLTSTTNDIAGFRIVQHIGVVRGLIVRSPTLAQGFLGGLKNIIGGNIGAYAEMCEQARQHAFDNLVDHAQQVGANAILAIRYESSEVGTSQSVATEVLCYGTAVVVEPVR
jgi:uncharacterized protein YbjQ (UPF0145 family)